MEDGDLTVQELRRRRNQSKTDEETWNGCTSDWIVVEVTKTGGDCSY
jgi:hypothetical protein